MFKKGSNIDYRSLNEKVTETGIESLRKQNITSNNFFIQKAEIEISTGNKSEKLIGSMKFLKPDKFLISIKSRTGIEALRIFISPDTILVNDRINRKLLYASHDYLRTKYGLPDSVFALLLGDYVSNSVFGLNKRNCLNGKINLDGLIDGIDVKYIIDCKLNKVIYASNEEILRGREVELKFDDFEKRGDILTAGKIEIRDVMGMLSIIIRIKKIEYPWNGSIEFIPGSRYELIKLL